MKEEIKKLSRVNKIHFYSSIFQSLLTFILFSEKANASIYDQLMKPTSQVSRYFYFFFLGGIMEIQLHLSQVQGKINSVNCKKHPPIVNSISLIC